MNIWGVSCNHDKATGWMQLLPKFAGHTTSALGDIWSNWKKRWATQTIGRQGLAFAAIQIAWYTIICKNLFLSFRQTVGPRPCLNQWAHLMATRLRRSISRSKLHFFCLMFVGQSLDPRAGHRLGPGGSMGRRVLLRFAACICSKSFLKLVRPMWYLSSHTCAQACLLTLPMDGKRSCKMRFWKSYRSRPWAQ